MVNATFSFEDLTKAYFDCRKNKRNTESALAFEHFSSPPPQRGRGLPPHHFCFASR
jgi:hypothetical protein